MIDIVLTKLKEEWVRLNESLITRNSLGNVISDTESSIKNFWKWFGNSKIVNTNGEPEVWFHYTNGEFSKFDIERGSGVAGRGIYLTSERFSDDRYGSNILELYVRCSNPLDLSESDKLINEHAKKMGMIGLYDLRTIPQMREWSKDFRINMIKSGYDGCFVNSNGVGKHLVVYHKDSVKHIKNKGEWAGDDINENRVKHG
jgi:hypothetical protein